VDFSEHGKLGESSGKNGNKQNLFVHYSNICVKLLFTG